MGAPMGSGAQTSPRDVAEVVDRDALAVLIHREFQRVWKHVGFAWDPRAVMLRRLSEKQGVSCSFRGLRAYSDWRKMTIVLRMSGIKHYRHGYDSTTMTVLKRDTHYHTYADYLVWSRSYGDELIDGTAYVREPPSPSLLHQETVGEVYRQIACTLEGKPLRVYVAPLDVRLPKSSEADDAVDTVVQPDVFIVSDVRKLDARGARGAPDWLAEVVSPSTARHDVARKVPVYERAGVREVWLINPVDRTVSIYRLEAGHYSGVTVLELKGQTPLTAVAGVSVDWDQVLAKML
jgi:Uma2 family endonuclease